MVFHKCNGRQLLTELFQHNHTLQQCDVVNTGRRGAGNESIQDINRLSSFAKILRSIKCVKHLTYIGPSGSKPSNRFLTKRSLGVKSWMRWIRTIRSPTTCIKGKKELSSWNQLLRDFQDKKILHFLLPNEECRLAHFTLNHHWQRTHTYFLKYKLHLSLKRMNFYYFYLHVL